MSDLASEVLLRLAKVGLAAILGLAVYLVLVGPLGQQPSTSLALLSWLSGATLLTILTSSPL